MARTTRATRTPETILSFVATYRRSRDLKTDTIKQLECVARAFERFAGPIPWRDVNDDLTNDWLCQLQDEGRLSPVTIYSRRRLFLTLWRAAYDAGLVERLPQRVRRIKQPDIVPVAFLADEIQAMLNVAEEMTGDVRGLRLPRRLWWRSFLLAAYDSGLRLSDLLSIERDWIWRGGRLSIVQAKTGRTHTVQFRAETMAAIEESMAACPRRRLIWPLWCSRDCWHRHFRRLRRDAGLSRGSSKWIRRSSASYVEAAHPGTGSAHLGHRSADLARKHYFDPRIVTHEATAPPSLRSLKKRRQRRKK